MPKSTRNITISCLFALSTGVAHAEAPTTNCCTDNNRCILTDEETCQNIIAHDNNLKHEEHKSKTQEKPAKFTPSEHFKTTLNGVFGAVEIEVLRCSDFPASEAPVTRNNKLRNHPWFSCELRTSCGELISAVWPKYSEGHLSGSKVHVDPSSNEGSNVFTVMITPIGDTLAITSAEPGMMSEAVSCE